MKATLLLKNGSQQDVGKLTRNLKLSIKQEYYLGSSYQALMKCYDTYAI